MYDVYLNERNDLLVIPRGNSIPIDLNRKWRKKRIVRSVSEQIREDVRIYGYHRRKLPLSRSMNALADKLA
ncbi:hypothetical protein [Bradyrhizobium sp. CCBAU 51753]|uniref:hypothetical protein n=1 Tax=Bradyrhizobium sp. CCBAU 51753 TaxID=1325100 RepID=UPI00188AB9AC|nr:hypothetical protein [Bradyrhizobium sp. CCBAU 51753]QOZ24175.1 hypothetical protein XH93_11775 [Bradyrhizobium sp. CCBAU 51753]